MTTPAALPRLMLALRRCSPTVRDQLTAGTLEQPRQVLEATAGRLRFTDAQLSAAVRHWAAEEVGRRTSRVEVFASASGAPTAHVVRVRERVERPGMSRVEVLCPYAHLHTWRPRGHQLHTHGWAKGREPDRDGSIGLRVPHCEGNTRGREVLANYELMLPPELRPVTQ